jgi:hypothetical protein
MANTRDILTALLKEDLIEAKKIINERLLEKLGDALEQKLVDFAPTVFEETKTLKGKQHKLDKNKNGKLDSEDFKMLRKEDLDINESEELTEEDLGLIQSFQEELASVVESIQQETGTELTESEIEEIANDMLNMISEQEEDEEDGEDEDEDEDKETKSSSNSKKGRVPGGVDY